MKFCNFKSILISNLLLENLGTLRILTGKKHPKIDVFSILVVSAKKRYSSFLEKVFVFLNVWIKVNVLKTSKTSTDCEIKTCRSLKRRAILKIPRTVF